MSNYKNILEEVKKLVFREDEPTVETPVEESTTVVAEQKFVDVTLSDGTLLQIEPDVQVGASVLIEDPELGMVPVPDGSYELEDGRIVVVAGGLVENVEEVAASEEVEEEMESTTEPVMTEKEVRKIIESVETHFASEIETLKNELATEREEAKKVNEAFINALEELAKKPTEEPKKENKSGFNFRKKSEKGIDALINLKTKK